ncbi:MAG: ABC transporter ATP-binding protein [Pontixanthobacter sp.]
MLQADRISLAGRLDDVSAAFGAGRVTAICGPNGAGKSTLLSVLAGLLTPDAGEVRLDDTVLASLTNKARARTVGYLPQQGEVAWDVSVRNLVGLGRLPFGDTAFAPIDAALVAMELEGFADRPVSTLSGGERARALLARVLAGEPRWLLIDEPLAALDIAHQLRLLRHLRAQADAGAGVIVVMHDLAAAMNHADRVLVLDEGRFAAFGTPEEALSEPTIAQVWHATMCWIGGRGARALVAA